MTKQKPGKHGGKHPKQQQEQQPQPQPQQHGQQRKGRQSHQALPPPQQPTFRSVRMGAHTPALVSHGNLDSQGATKEEGFFVGGHLVSTGRPKPGEVTQNLFEDKSEPWGEPLLTPLGLYYPLGPCQTRLPISDLDRILKTLRNVFRTLSLHTLYRNTPISATCISLDQVELEVVIFGARDDPEEMILEIFRRDGDCVSYHVYADQIMSAVRGVASGEEPRPVITCWNLTMLSEADNIGEDSTDDDSITEALEITYSMLFTDRYDTRRLGLETLVHMTDPNKSGLTTAKLVAECLLNPKGPVQEQLSEGVLGYALQDVEGPGTHRDAEAPSFGVATEGSFAYLGLIVLSQTLQVAAGDKTKAANVQAFLDVCQGDLVGNILRKVSDVQTNPHRAYYAVQCLSALCSCIPSLKSKIKGTDMEKAQLVGESCHLALATVTEKLLVTLQA